MSYDPSHRRPPRQERWPSATPAEGWPSYRDGDPYRDREQATSRYETDRQGVYQADYQRLAVGSGDRGYQAGGYQTGGYPADGYSDNHTSGYATDDFGRAANGYGDANGYGYDRAADGYAGGSGYADGYAGGNGHADGYAGAAHGYPEVADGFDGAADGYGWAESGYGQATGGYAGDAGGYLSQPDEYDWEPNRYGNAAHGYGAGRDDYPPQVGYLGPGSYTEYNEPGSGDPRLMAPDASVHPDTWQAEQDSRREARQRGMAVGAVTEILGIAVAIGVSTLVAGIVKARTSPVAAMGSVVIDRTPATLRNALVDHFGTHGRTVLLLGMYAAIAFAALVIGVVARRDAALGVAGIAAFTLFAAFVAVTRPAGHVGDVTPAVVGGIAGVAALLWLVRASAPIMPLRPARGGARRRAR
jgi:hypothetical protein